MRSIVLTGFMGTGKSSIGQLLADRCRLRFIDVDGMIVAAAGKAITEIFAEEGETSFRDRETAALQSLLVGQPSVISTGGGAVIRGENRQILRQLGIVVNLTAPPEEILRRLELAEDRPLLRKSLEEIRNLMWEREAFYAEADIRIDTTGKNIEDIAAQILEFTKDTSLCRS